MRLYVMRHGIAVEGAERGGPDGSRPLTAKGRKRVRRTAKAFARLGEPVDRLYTSPLVRAVQTAELLARAVGAEEVGVLEELLPLAAPEALLAALGGGARKDEGVAVCTHDPLATALIGLFLGSEEGLAFPKGAIVRVDLPEPPQAEGAQVRWTLLPKERAPRPGAPLAKSPEELAREEAAAEAARRARKAKRRAERERKRARKRAAKARREAEREARRAEKEERAEAGRAARKRASQARPRPAGRPQARAVTPAGPRPEKRVARPRRSVAKPRPATPATKAPPPEASPAPERRPLVPRPKTRRKAPPRPRPAPRAPPQPADRPPVEEEVFAGAPQGQQPDEAPTPPPAVPGEQGSGGGTGGQG